MEPVTGFLGPEGLTGRAAARVAVVPVPYERTVSYGGGTSRGPSALLQASSQLELFDEELALTIAEMVGIYTHPDLPVGDLSSEAMLDWVAKTVEALLLEGKWVATIGGEHTVALGAIRAFRRHFGDGFAVLQLDAHADLRDRYLGDPYSHACVMRRVAELGVRSVGVGIRSLCEEEWCYVRDHAPGSLFPARVLAGDEGWIDRVLALLPARVYLSLDVDVLDPSCMPATGAPEPGGLDYGTVLRLLRRLGAEREVIGCDLTELSPIPGQPASDFLAAKLLYKVIGYNRQTILAIPR